MLALVNTIMLCDAQTIEASYSQAQDWSHPGGIGNTWDKKMKPVSTDVYVPEKALPAVVAELVDGRIQGITISNLDGEDDQMIVTGKELLNGNVIRKERSN